MRLIDREIIEKAAEKFETPLYLYDTDILREEMARFRKALGPDIGINYSMKANSFILETMAELADHIEVCSMGEFLICKKMGIAPSKLLISGVLKKSADLEQILEYGQGESIYTAESMGQFEHLCRWSREHRTHIRCYPRLTSGNQFGMDQETVRSLMRKAQDEPYLTVEGLHFFSGTMKRMIRKQTKELKMLDQYLLSLEAENLHVPLLEYGTGFAVSYFQKDKDDSISGENLTAFADLAGAMEWKGKICIEMGRALSAMCGSYLTRVMDKKTSDGRGYLITDGGIHQIGYDGQIKGMYEPWIRQIPDRKDEPLEWTVCGSLCTVNDILVQSCRLSGIEEGDVLSFDQAGAYCAMEGMSLFLSHELPQVVLCSREEGFRSVRERMETFELNSPERAERK